MFGALKVLFCLTLLATSAKLQSSKIGDSASPPSSDGCKPYPKELKSLTKCCDIPILFQDDYLANCEFLCSESAKDKDNPDCPINCLFENNRIIWRGEMNISAMEHMYEKFGLADPNWKPVIHYAIEKCPFEKTDKKSMQETFEEFEKCVNPIFLDHCVESKEAEECDAVEDFMLKCQNYVPDCNEWPRWIVKLPEQCCDNRPDLFTSALLGEAGEKCEAQISNLGKMQCKASYLIEKTGVKTGEKWNFNIAADLLKTNSKQDTKWTTPIDKSIETCEKMVADDTKDGKDATYLDFWFYECLKGSLADFCPAFNPSTKKCRRIKKYKEACPASVPPRKIYMVNGKM